MASLWTEVKNVTKLGDTRVVCSYLISCVATTHSEIKDMPYVLRHEADRWCFFFQGVDGSIASTCMWYIYMVHIIWCPDPETTRWAEPQINYYTRPAAAVAIFMCARDSKRERAWPDADGEGRCAASWSRTHAVLAVSKCCGVAKASFED
jgi:hypothetical protein